MSETQTVSRLSYTVKLIGVLATAAGTRRVLVNSETELSLTDVISKLDEQDCNLFQGLRTKLDPETVVTIIPVAHGG